VPDAVAPEPAPLTEQMLLDAFEQIKNRPLERTQLEPVHPAILALCRVDLGKAPAAPVTEGEFTQWLLDRMMT
jgi:hypothetical protein